VNALKLDPSQRQALYQATANPLSLITGAAGTGKTSLIAEIRKQTGATLLAPTGKAAARLREVTGADAVTVHRYLKFDGTKFQREHSNDCLVIDEAPMVDSALLAHVVRCNPPKLILVGDVAQLPPVGRGAPFQDLIDAHPDKVVELQVCYRAQAAIHKAANRIRFGLAPALVDRGHDEIWRMGETGAGQPTSAAIAKWVLAGHYDPLQDMILSCRNGETDEDYGSVLAINNLVMRLLNPHDPDVAWKVADRVIMCKNHASKDIWNGDTGSITGIDRQGKVCMQLDRNGLDLILERRLVNDLKHAYCLTVHKSQGSQYRRVIFICLQAHAHMLDRSLIYTAATRAREAIRICGQMSAFFAGIKRSRRKRTVLSALRDA